MSNGRFEIGAGGSDPVFSDMIIPPDIVDEDLQNQRADRLLSFAHIEHTVESLGLEVGDAHYYDFPLDMSSNRRVIVARVHGRFGEELHVYSNDEIPHPSPDLTHARRIRMTAYAASSLGKRIMARGSSMDCAAPGKEWYSDGPFVGPQIVYDIAMGLAEVRGSRSHLLLELPEPSNESAVKPVPERTGRIVSLARLLDRIPTIHRVEGVTVILPTAARYSGS